MKKNIKLVITGILAAGLVAAASGCGCSNKAAPETTPAPTPVPTEATNISRLQSSGALEGAIPAVIHLADGREIKMDLYPNLAPITVENFINLAESGFYDGLIFHRIIDDFMIQGGGFDAELNQKEAEPIKGEFAANGVQNDLPHMTGVVSMARTMASMDSGSSQFFIMDSYQPLLDGQYAAFGRVTDQESLAVVEELSAVETHDVSQTMQDVPVDPPVIETITIGEASAE